MPAPLRRVRRARVGVLIVLVIASGFVGMHVRAWRQRKAAVAQLREALQGYTECMLGAPLGDGESATARMRRMPLRIRLFIVPSGVSRISATST